MTNKRRYRKAADRRVWVFSEPNPAVSPKEIARILARVAMAAEAQAKLEARRQPSRESDDE